jgi:hypothetical protein
MSNLQQYFEELLSSLLTQEAHFHKRFANPKATDILNSKYTLARFCTYLRNLQELEPAQAAKSLVDKINCSPQYWYTREQDGALLRKVETLEPMIACAMRDAIAQVDWVELWNSLQPHIEPFLIRYEYEGLVISKIQNNRT